MLVAITGKSLVGTKPKNDVTLVVASNYYSLLATF